MCVFFSNCFFSEFGEEDGDRVKEAVKTFVHSCAGYSVATYVLVCRWVCVWVGLIKVLWLCGRTPDQHHTGLRQVENSSMGTHTGPTSYWVEAG